MFIIKGGKCFSEKYIFPVEVLNSAWLDETVQTAGQVEVGRFPGLLNLSCIPKSFVNCVNAVKKLIF